MIEIAAHDGAMTEQSDAPRNVVVTNDKANLRYEARIEDALAGFTNYLLHGDQVVFTHAEVYPRWEGQGVGSTLARGALDDVIGQGKLITPVCPFIVSFVRRNPSYLEHVDEEHRRELEPTTAK
jgi:predicted GNAT family acetyltransferase